MQCHICQEGWSSSTLTSVGQADTTNSRTVHFDERRTLSRRPTMRHVAALAGVSLRTVSRVINDDPTVAEALRDQVRAAVDRLNYRPNLVASHFRRRDGRSFTVGLVLHDVANPFLAKTQRAVQDGARLHGCDMLAASGVDTPAREREVVERLLAEGSRGSSLCRRARTTATYRSTRGRGPPSCSWTSRLCSWLPTAFWWTTVKAPPWAFGT